MSKEGMDSHHDNASTRAPTYDEIRIDGFAQNKREIHAIRSTVYANTIIPETIPITIAPISPTPKLFNPTAPLPLAWLEHSDPDLLNASAGISTFGNPLLALTLKLPSELGVTVSHVNTSTSVSLPVYSPAELGMLHDALDEVPAFVRRARKGGLDTANVEVEDCEMNAALVVRKDEL